MQLNTGMLNANAAAVVPNVVVVTPDGARMHRPTHTNETHLWCPSNEWVPWTPVERDRVASESLCNDCFAAALTAAAAVVGSDGV
ncbi:MAG: hypothetical protein ABEI98_07160 [Halorhabdus sp.]